MANKCFNGCCWSNSVYCLGCEADATDIAMSRLETVYNDELTAELRREQITRFIAERKQQRLAKRRAVANAG